MSLITDRQSKIFYQAFLDEDQAYEGIFFVGIKTTGIFCRPTCFARKPKFKNCEFFNNVEAALAASYRPCMRCCPLLHPGQVSALIQTLIEAIEAHPEKRWRKSDFVKLSVDESTVRRQFKKRFGMTFIEYARARRMGLAIKQIQNGNSVISAQLDSGYESSSGFRDAFAKIMGTSPTKFGKRDTIVLQSAWIDTRLGTMLTIADEEALYLLEFVDRRNLEREVERLRIQLNATIIPERTKIIQQIEDELQRYFEGMLKEFKTHFRLLGTPFQKRVWSELMCIPYGQTRSYNDQAKAMGKETFCRVVANANGANQLAIIVPCHRIINSNGELGGYSGGINRKKWLIAHENSINNTKAE